MNLYEVVYHKKGVRTPDGLKNTSVEAKTAQSAKNKFKNAHRDVTVDSVRLFARL